MIESPCASNSRERARNEQYLAPCVLDCPGHGESPFASTDTRHLDDDVASEAWDGTRGACRRVCKGVSAAASRA